VTIWLNGEARELPDGVKLLDAVEAVGAAAGRSGIAVAVDGEVVPRDRWGDIALSDGQRVEVVHAVQGG
jgi:sulfur carrier protein